MSIQAPFIYLKSHMYAVFLLKSVDYISNIIKRTFLIPQALSLSDKRCSAQ